jgi:hypothetical protein
VSNTPETDAIVARHFEEATDWSTACDDLERHSKGLERERDMGRDMVHGLRKQRAIARNFGEQMERERDEAREAAERYRRKTLSQDANLAEAHRLVAAAKQSLNAIHVEVGGWIAAMMKEEQ